MRYLFRADASQLIGAGHIIRCMSLASALQARGAQTCFVSLDLPAHLDELLRSNGHEVRRLPETVRGDELADAYATLIGESVIAACVVDHYQLGQSWEAMLMERAPVLAIDDLGRAHVSRWVLDQNYYSEPEVRYEHGCPPYVQRLFGPSFALLRNEFAQARLDARERDGAIHHVLVFLGGMDAGNITAIALKSISMSMAPEVFVTVIAGASHPDLPALHEWCSNRGRAALHVQVSNITQHMLAADLAIGAGGSSTWERCVCGLPSVALSLAENQRDVILEGTRAGFLWGIDHVPSIEELVMVLRLLSVTPGIVQHLSRQALQMTDGRGADRVADLLLPKTMQIRHALTSDARMIYEWRSSPEVLGVSRNNDFFTYEDHISWLEQVLRDSKSLLLVGIYEESEVGVVRYDLKGNRAEVSIFLAPEKIGKGLGRVLLASAEAKLRLDHPYVTFVDAWVNSDNRRSIQLFQHLGYSHRIGRLEKEFA